MLNVPDSDAPMSLMGGWRHGRHGGGRHGGGGMGTATAEPRRSGPAPARITMDDLKRVLMYDGGTVEVGTRTAAPTAIAAARHLTVVSQTAAVHQQIRRFARQFARDRASARPWRSTPAGCSSTRMNWTD